MRVAAAIFTCFYLGFIVGLIHTNWPEFQTLKPNEWGDFLAGTVGPLAFAWLVFSVIMQGRELENSRTVLEHQARELASSARAHRDQAQAASDSIAQQNRVYTASLWLKTRNLEVVTAEKLEILSKFLDNQEPRSPLLSSDFRELLERMRVSILTPYGIKNSTTKPQKMNTRISRELFKRTSRYRTWKSIRMMSENLPWRIALTGGLPLFLKKS